MQVRRLVWRKGRVKVRLWTTGILDSDRGANFLLPVPPAMLPIPLWGSRLQAKGTCPALPAPEPHFGYLELPTST